MIRIAAFVFILSLVCTSFAFAESDGELEACEGALKVLVNKLEGSGEFSAANKLDALPAANSDYSPCFVPADDDSDRDAITYFVYRHADDVTVYVYRAPVISSTFVWYGPFFSAYRK